MKTFLTNLTSLYWWVSVVIVGILINLTSAYLKNRLDGRLSRISGWWRKRSEAKKAETEQSVVNLVDNPHEQYMAAFDGLRHGLRAVTVFLLSVLALVSGEVASTLGQLKMGGRSGIRLPEALATLFFFALGSVFAILTVLEWKTSIAIFNLIAEARGRENADS